jgi:hypothetical protein
MCANKENTDICICFIEPLRRNVHNSVNSEKVSKYISNSSEASSML